MLLVESSNQKDISVLEELFNRDGNYFSVPFKKSNAIKDLVGSLRYQYFATQMEDKKNHPQKKLNEKDLKNQSYLLKKIIKMIENFLKLKISLANIREVFELIKQLEEKLKDYHLYILKLNEVFMMDSENRNEEQEDPQQSVENLNQLFQNVLNPLKNNNISTLYSDIKGIEEQEKMLSKINDMEVDHSVSAVRSLSSLSSKEITKTTTRGKKSDLKLFKHEGLRIQGSISPKKYSYSYQKIEEEDALSQNCEKMEVTRVSDGGAYDSQTISTLYCPDWKKNEEKKQVFGKILPAKYNQPNQTRSHHSNDSDFALDLSGEVRPTPSVLTNQSIKDLMRRDKRQDIRKSHILKQSIIGMIKPSQINEKDYEKNMKSLKLNQKLKKQSLNREIKSSINTVPSMMKKSQTQGHFETVKTEPDHKIPIPNIPKETKERQSKQGLFFKFKKACFGK